MEEHQCFDELHASTEALLEACLQFGSELVEAAPCDASENASESADDQKDSSTGGSDRGTARNSLDATLSAYFAKSFDLRRRNTETQFSVAVIALAKCGKSTFINALCGAELLPVSNVPETARICRISHASSCEIDQPQLLDKSLGVDIIQSGEDAIRSHLQNLNTKVRLRSHQLSDEVLLDIRVPLVALEQQLQQHGNMSFALLDTPGPNEFGEEALRSQVERLLDGVDAVIYLLDYTKLRTKDEADLFRRLKEINPGLLRRLSLRLRFVVNKADSIGTSDGMSEEETKLYVSKLVTEQLSGDGFRLLPEEVLLVSAQDALLSRLMLRPNPVSSGKTWQRFCTKAFGVYGYRKARLAADLSSAAQAMLSNSGIAKVEEQVLQSLYTRAGPLKLMAIVDDTHRMLSKMVNTAAVNGAALQKDAEVLRTETAALQEQLTKTLSRFDDVQDQSQSLEGEVVDEVRTRLSFLGEQLKEKVSKVMRASAADESAVSGRWRGVAKRFKNFLHLRSGDASKDKLQSELQELHSEIFSTIDEEVRAFWHDLEMASNERQRALLRRLNVHLEQLGRMIESVVSEQLSVRLEPVDLRLPERTSATHFHDSLQALFAAGITQVDTTKTRTLEKEETEWEKHYRHGMCRIGEFYVAKPVKRTVNETYTDTKYHIQPEKVQEYFCTLIDKTVTDSVKAVRLFVGQHLSKSLESARASITTYAESFTSAMMIALHTSEQGERARLAALARVRAQSERLELLLQQTVALQGQAEALFPDAAEEAALEHALSLSFGDGDLLDDEATIATTVGYCAPPPPPAAAAAAAPAAAYAASAADEDEPSKSDATAATAVAVAATAAALTAAAATASATAALTVASTASNSNTTPPFVCDLDGLSLESAALQAVVSRTVENATAADAAPSASQSSDNAEQVPLGTSSSSSAAAMRSTQAVAEVEPCDGTALTGSVCSLFDAHSDLGSASFMSTSAAAVGPTASVVGNQHLVAHHAPDSTTGAHESYSGRGSEGGLDSSGDSAFPRTSCSEEDPLTAHLSVGMATVCLSGSSSSGNSTTSSSSSSGSSRSSSSTLPSFGESATSSSSDATFSSPSSISSASSASSGPDWEVLSDIDHH